MQQSPKTIQIKGIKIGMGAPKICMPLVGKTMDELLASTEEVLELKPDIVEWRVDFFSQVENISRVIDALDKLREKIADFPLLFTCRDASEGGVRKLSAQTRMRLIQEVVCSGKVDMVDIELATAKEGLYSVITVAKDHGVSVVLSSHNFNKTPTCETIIAILREEQEMGADIAKIAVMPNSPADVIALMSATQQMYNEYANIPLITMSMGQLGLISRMAGSVFGSAVTFGAGKEASAPGQIAIRELRRCLALISEQK